MPDYKAMYFRLAAQVADVVEQLMKAQQEGEESCMNGEALPPVKLAEIKEDP